MSFYFLFYGLLLLFYDFLALTGYSSLVGINQFRRIQEQMGARKAHWTLRLVAITLVIMSFSIR